jgi:Arc/MetJ-type ribon-helix-helix transcriptional regulator
MFRSKSNENASTKAKNLISKLQQEKREREKIKELRTKLEQRRKQTEEDRLKNDQLSQQFENKRIVTE